MILTLLGTAAVAVTFYFHDVRRDNARDLKDAIASVEEDNGLKEYLRAILAETRATDERIFVPGADKKVWSYYVQQTGWENNLDDSAGRLESLRRLVLTLENPKQYQNELTKLGETQNRLKNLYITCANTLSNVFVMKIPKPHAFTMLAMSLEFTLVGCKKTR